MTTETKPIYRNVMQLTQVTFTDKKQFAFGFLKEPIPRMAFLPHWIIKAFKINDDDVGYEFDVLFIEQSEGRAPLIIGIIEEDVELKPSMLAGQLHGVPGGRRSFATLGDDIPNRTLLEQIVTPVSVPKPA